MTDDPAVDITGDLHGLLADLLPVLAPSARFSGGMVVIPVGDDRQARISTAPLLQAAAREPRHSWPRLVDVWLREVTARAGQRPDADAGPLGISMLRLRLAPKLDPRRSAELATVPYGPHFDGLIVADRPDRIETLTRADVARLITGEKDPGRIAYGNTEEHEHRTFDVRDFEVGPSEWVRAIAQDGSPYVSTALLVVDRYLPGPVEYGALVAAPRFSMVLAHEVTSDAALGVIGPMQAMARAMYDSASDPCVPGIFWWIAGQVHAVAATPERGEVGLSPSLRDMVERLPRA